MQTLFYRLLNISGFSAKIIKIDLYNSELYRFKVGAFFETQCIYVSVLYAASRGALKALRFY